MDAHVVLELREDAPHGLSDMVWGHFHLSGLRVNQLGLDLARIESVTEPRGT